MSSSKGRHRFAGIATSVGIGAMLGASVLAPSAAFAADPSFTDSAFKACVNESLGQSPNATITEAQAATVTSLRCDFDGIKSLGGAESLKSLTTLALAGNNISDISPIAGAPLQVVNINGNKVSDLSPLASATSLTRLDAEGNGIKDLTPLAGKGDLSILGLTGNLITDISPLATLTGLTDLTLTRNTAVTDLSPLSKMDTLRSLRLGGMNLKGLSAISKLSGLTVLYVGENPNLSSLSEIAGLTGLTDLEAPGTGLTEVASLKALNKLNKINLNKNHISDISPLSGVAPSASFFTATDQQVNLPAIPVGAAQESPVVSASGSAVKLSARSGNPVIGQDGKSWSFTATGANEISWTSPVNHGSFSGVLAQESTGFAPKIETNALQEARIGAPYVQKVEVTSDGVPVVKIEGLPAGLSFSSPVSTGKNGYSVKISGTPTAKGSYGVKVSATNSWGEGTRNYKFLVGEANAVSVAHIGDQVNRVKDHVSLQVEASSNFGTELKYSATGLPDGLSINAKTGAITGVPAKAGKSAVTITVSTEGVRPESVQFAWTIKSNAAPPAVHRGEHGAAHGLALTGGEAPVAIGVVALALLAAGGGLVLYRRRVS